MKRSVLPTIVLCGMAFSMAAGPTQDELFRKGIESYRVGDFATSAKWFGESVAQQPSSGALQNLGLAEWQNGQVGLAILAWERAAWMDPANRAVGTNLQFARQKAQIDAPALAWNEVPSTWLSISVWAWLGTFGLWAAVGLITIPNVFRWSRTVWPQALAATGLALFLLSVPAQLGIRTRARIGYVVSPGAALRLSPTRDAETVTQLSAGEPVRVSQHRGQYVFVRTSRNAGWLEPDQFQLVCPR